MRRGHHVTIATTPYYRLKVEALGITFHPMRPDWDPTDPELIQQCDDLKKGPEVLYRKMLLPELRGTYTDLLSAARSADILIAGEIVYAAPLVAEKLNLRWVSLILSPFSFFSSFDPSVMVNAPALIHLRKAGPSVYRAGLNIARLATRHWSNPVRQAAARRRAATEVRSDISEQVLASSRSGPLFALARRATARLACANIPARFRLLRALGGRRHSRVPTLRISRLLDRSPSYSRRDRRQFTAQEISTK